MKKVLTLSAISLLMLYLAGCKQTKSLSTALPATVSAAFSAKFPEAKAVKWAMENEQDFEAEFKLPGKKMSAIFSNTGEWLESETDINPEDMPAAVSESIARHFPGYEVEEVEMVEKPEKEVVYEAELQKGEESLEVVFSASGQLLSQENDDDEN